MLLIAGFQAPSVALALAAFSVATALPFHRDFANQNQVIHFLKNLAIAGGFLDIVAFGAGAFSIDGRRGTAKPPSATSPASLERGLTGGSQT